MARSAPPTVSFACPQCHAGQEWVHVEGATGTTCRRCQHEQPIFPRALEDGQLVACPLCGLKVLYKQKDFRQAIGCLVVLVAAVLAPFTYYVSLVVAALIDLVIYSLSGEVVICYRYDCRAHMRHFSPGPAVKPFDLSIHDYYKTLATQPKDAPPPSAPLPH